MIPRAVDRCTGIFLTEISARKVDEDYATNHRLKWGLLLQLRSIGSYNTWGRESKESRKDARIHLPNSEINFTSNKIISGRNRDCKPTAGFTSICLQIRWSFIVNFSVSTQLCCYCWDDMKVFCFYIEGQY